MRSAYNAFMQCNIDAKGKAARLISGALTLIAGLVLIGLWMAGTLPQGWVAALGALALAGGAFQIYEGWAGWCVMRAMGFKTPM